MQFDILDLGPIKIQPGEVAKLNRAVSDLYVGQILKTVVVKAINDQTVMLNINGNNINAQTAHKFEPGQSLEVEVQRQGDSVILKVQSGNIPPQTIQKALTQVITQQLPANQTLNQLVTMLQNQQLPPSITQSLQNFLQSLPSLNQLSYALPSLVAQTGLFTENKLKKDTNNASSPVKNDLKSLLWSVLSSSKGSNKSSDHPYLSLTQLDNPEHAPLAFPGARPQPFQPFNPNLFSDTLSLGEQLQQLAKIGLARIVSLQLTHLASTQQGHYQVMLDLPFVVDDTLQTIPLLIEQLPNPSPDQVAPWRAQFAVNLSAIGAVQTSIELTYKSLSIVCHVEKAQTQTQLNSIEQQVRQWSQEQGLILKRWQVILGLQKNNFSDHTFSMVDIKL